MHDFLRLLPRHEVSIWTRHGVNLSVIVGITAFRLFIPLDTAPFLLHRPGRDHRPVIRATEFALAERERLGGAHGVVGKTASVGELTGQLRGLVSPVNVD